MMGWLVRKLAISVSHEPAGVSRFRRHFRFRATALTRQVGVDLALEE